MTSLPLRCLALPFGVLDSILGPKYSQEDISPGRENPERSWKWLSSFPEYQILLTSITSLRFKYCLRSLTYPFLLATVHAEAVETSRGLGVL